MGGPPEDGAAVALLRGINVGGRTIRMESLTRALADFEVESVGAAGTLAIRRFSGGDAFARALKAALPFEAPAAIVPQAELATVLRTFGNDGPVPPGVRRSVTVLLGEPRAAPPLPLERPAAGLWQTRLLARSGRWIFGWYRRREEPSERLVYPNEVVEREFGVPATTRWWETLEAVAGRLDDPASPDDPSPRARSPRARPARRGGTSGPGRRPRGRPFRPSRQAHPRTGRRRRSP
jgi:hypothetical protein